MPPARMNVALKEWDVVCRALQTGRQMLLLRKGGIIEAIGGFELEKRQFLLFPTFLHQNREMVKPEDRKGVIKLDEEPMTITMTAAAEVTDIIRLTDRLQMDALSSEHLWEPSLIDMRFNYRPNNPLYLLLVRTYQLPTQITIQNTLEYAGCKSWVPLGRDIDCGDASPVLSDEQFGSRQQRIKSALQK